MQFGQVEIHRHENHTLFKSNSHKTQRDCCQELDRAAWHNPRNLQAFLFRHALDIHWLQGMSLIWIREEVIHMKSTLDDFLDIKEERSTKKLTSHERSNNARGLSVLTMKFYNTLDLDSNVRREKD